MCHFLGQWCHVLLRDFQAWIQHPAAITKWESNAEFQHGSVEVCLLADAVFQSMPL